MILHHLDVKALIAVNLPCNPNNPLDPIFDILVGRAQSKCFASRIFRTNIESRAKCGYHGQFGFGDPVTRFDFKIRR